MSTPTGKAHPLAAVFPLLKGDEFQALIDDIEQHGLSAPVLVTPDGTILDGRNRYRACKAIADRRTGPHLTELLKTRTIDVPADEQVRIILSLNVHRRHLTASQRAMTAARLSQIGNFAGSPQRDRALIMSVSERTLRDADTVFKSGDGELVAAVDAGSVSVSDAAKRLKPPKTEPKPAAPAEPPPSLSDFEDLITDGPARPDSEPGVGTLDTEPVDPPRRPRETPILVPEPPPAHGYYGDLAAQSPAPSYDASVKALVPRSWEAAADVLEVPRDLLEIDRSQDAHRVLAVLLHGLPDLSSTAKRALLNKIASSMSKPDLQSWVSAVRHEKGLG